MMAIRGERKGQKKKKQVKKRKKKKPAKERPVAKKSRYASRRKPIGSD